MFDPTAPTWPENDDDFRDDTIKKVTAEAGGGWSITDAEGWSFGIQSDSPIPPAEGMSIRYYGRGIGYAVRGVFLDGHAVYYRTEDEEKAYRAVQQYGASTQELLDRWDAGKVVWTIVMGGISPGYEQALQITAFEMMRFLLTQEIDWAKLDEDKAAVRELYDRTGKAVEAVSGRLGLSGAQHGAAFNMALTFVRQGPVKAMSMVSRDRHQQQSRNFPTLDEVFTQREAAVIAQIFPQYDTAEDLLFSLTGELRHSFTLKEAEALLSRMSELRPDT